MRITRAATALAICAIAVVGTGAARAATPYDDLLSSEAARLAAHASQPEAAGAQQALGETPSLVHLVGERPAVDAAVGHASGRCARTGARAQFARHARGRVLERRRQVGVLVELLELALARRAAPHARSSASRSEPTSGGPFARDRGCSSRRCRPCRSRPGVRRRVGR